jgi:type I restriction enzyme S subunit
VTTATAPWPKTALRELLVEQNVRAGDLAESERQDLEVLSLTKDRGLIPQRERFVHRVATDDVSKYKVVEPGWIVYNPYVIWEGAIHASTYPGRGLVSPVYPVWSRLDDDGGFLDYALRVPEIVAAYQSRSAGAVNRRRSISKEGFLEIMMPCPTLDERRRIAMVLNHVRGLVGANRRIFSLAVELADGVVDRLMTGGMRGEPTVTTELGDVPSSWEVAPLRGYLLDSKYGLGNKGSDHGTYPLLRMTNQKDGRIVAEDLQYIDLSDAQLERFRVCPDDVLFNRTNSHELVGRTAIFDLPGDYVFASYLVRLRAKRELLRPAFLNYYLGWHRTQARLRSIARRAIGQSNISASRLAGTLIAVPGPDEQDAIVETIDQAVARVALARKQLRACAELHGGLVTELLTGRLPMSEVELTQLRPPR